MKLDIKSLLKDKNVLRIVVFLCAMNVLGYLLVRDLDSVAFFGIVGFLATYFSKNMIVVLLIAMISTNFLTVLRKGKDVVEGMKSSRKPTKKVEDKSLSGPSAASDEEDEEMSSGKPGKLDDSATIEAAYENLDTMMGDDSMESMSKAAEKLKQQNKQLTENMKNVAPMMKRAHEMMGAMGGPQGVENMINKVGGMIDKLGVLMPNNKQ